MYLTYKVKTSRNKSQVRYEKDFSDSIMELDKYFFNFTISVLCNNKKVAIIEGTIFDNDLIANDDEDIADIADSIEGTVAGAITKLDDDCIIYGEVCYIERFYIFLNFRQKGLGSYLLSNLQYILKFLLNAKIEFFTTFINPHNYADKKWICIEDNDEGMKSLMVSFFTKYGFKEIDDSGYYAKECSSTKDKNEIL